MKLLKLEILNLASLDNQSGEVIDFEAGALGGTSIFSIVGPTGSGKSTLLDAICLALYNRAPRYPRKKNDRNQGIEIYGAPDDSEKNRLAPTDGRNILTRGKKNGYSKLTFLANNGNVYRAEWHVTFQLKNYKNAETYLYLIRQKDDKNQEEIPCQWEDLPTIIGLEYDQFLRTVLIAQGSFANFLTAKENERYELLEKLIGCEEMYSTIAAKIKEKRDQAQERYNDISAQVKNFKQYVLNDENLAALNEQISRLEQEEKLLTEQIKAIEKALEWYTIEAKCQEEIDKQTANEAAALQALQAIKTDVDRLNLHDAIHPAVDVLREVRRLDLEITNDNEAINRTNAQIAQQKQLIDVNKAELKTLEENAKTAQDAIDQAKPHIQKARELSTTIRNAKTALNEKKTALDNAKTETEKADKALKKNAVDIEKAQKRKSEAEEAYNTLKAATEAKLKSLLEKEEEQKNTLAATQAKIKDISGDALSQAKDRATDDLNDIIAAIDIVGRINDLNEELRVNAERQNVLIADNKTCEDMLKNLCIAQLQTEVETLQNTYTLMTSENWASHRSKLKDGEPCPLCGSDHHPYAHDPDKIQVATSSLLNLLNDKKQTLDQQQRSEKQLSSKISKNKGELDSLTKARPKYSKDLDAQEQKWTAIEGKHAEWTKDKSALDALKPALQDAKQQAEKAWKDFRDVETSITLIIKNRDDAANARSEYEKLSQENLKQAEGNITAANTALESHKAQTENLNQQLQEKTRNQQAATKAYEDANQSLSGLQLQFDAELGGKNPDDEETRLNKAKKDADQAVNDKNNHIAKLSADQSKSEGILNTLRDRLKDAETTKLAKNQALNQWIGEYNSRAESAIDEMTVAAMLDATDDWEAIKNIKADRERALNSAQTLKDKAVKDMELHLQSKPEKTAEELNQDKQTIEQNSKKQQLDAAKLQLQQHHDAIKNMGDKADELAQATAENDDWKAINDSIGGDGKTLRKIAQCYTLRFLVEHANDEIRKFNSRYELQQVKNSLGIRVIDHDRADDVRDTTSLSGGETFIVSLGLALGLSSLSSRNISFDNLFIDEGFGTLDPDTLATVIDSLAMLQTSQGKKVGVISHTDTMSERITTQIRIIKNGNSGSSHIEIYP